MPNKPAASDPYLFTRLTWLAMFVSLAMYVVIVSIVPPPAGASGSALNVPLLVLSGVLALASVPVRQKLVPANPQTGYSVAFILSETAALVGLVLHFATGSGDSWICFVIGAAAMLINAPRRADFSPTARR